MTTLRRTDHILTTITLISGGIRRLALISGVVKSQARSHFPLSDDTTRHGGELTFNPKVGFDSLRAHQKPAPTLRPEPHALRPGSGIPAIGTPPTSSPPTSPITQMVLQPRICRWRPQTHPHRSAGSRTADSPVSALLCEHDVRPGVPDSDPSRVCNLYPWGLSDGSRSLVF